MMKKSIGSGRGSVYNVLLKALQSGDKYAYEICKEIEEKSNGSYILKEQSSYSGLRRLEQRNEITSYWKDSDLGTRRHYYSLTEKGRQRLESSNFSWEDTRDDIVDSLFEKSELDKTIDDVSTDIDMLKKSTLTNDNQETIDEIISQTDKYVQNQVEEQESKVEETEELKNNEELQQEENEPKQVQSSLFAFFDNQPAEKEPEVELNENIEEEVENDKAEEKTESQSSEQTDLFSIFNNQYVQEESTESDDFKEELAEEKVDDNIEYAEESEENTELKEELAEEPSYEEEQTEDSVENEYQEEVVEDDERLKDDADEYKEQASLEEIYDVEKIEESSPFEEETESEQIENVTPIPVEEFATHEDNETELESFLQDSTEEKSISNQTDLEKFLAENSDEVEEDSKDNFEDLMKNLQTVEENKIIDEEIETQTEEKTVSLQKNTDDIEFYRQLHQGTNNYIDGTFDEKPSKNYFDDLSPIQESSMKDIENTENNAQPQNKGIDYEGIFGDLISNDSNQNIESSDTKDEVEPDFNINHDNLFEPEESQTEMNAPSNFEQDNLDDMPRQVDDINRTLMSTGKSRIDEMYEMQENYKESRQEENHEESYYQDENYYSGQNIDTVHNVSFDRKYEKLENNFNVPNYKIRYQQKGNQKRHSRFILSNKLSLISSLILCLFLAVVNTSTLLACKLVTTPKSQIIVCYVAYIIITAVVVFNLAKYIINPNKRMHNISKIDFIVSLAIGVIMFVVTLMVNIQSGMTLNNITDYLASLIMPLAFALTIVFSNFTKRILAQSPKFYQ